MGETFESGWGVIGESARGDVPRPNLGELIEQTRLSRDQGTEATRTSQIDDFVRTLRTALPDAIRDRERRLVIYAEESPAWLYVDETAETSGDWAVHPDFEAIHPIELPEFTNRAYNRLIREGVKRGDISLFRATKERKTPTYMMLIALP